MKIAPQFVADPSAASSMSADAMPIFFYCFFVIVAIAAFLTLVPLVLQFAIKLVTKFKPSFKEAFFINLKVMGIYWGISLLFGVLIGISIFALHAHGEVVTLLTYLPSFAFLPIEAWLYGRLIKLPESGPIGIGRGALVLLVQFLIYIAFAIGIMMLVFVAGIVEGLVGN